MNPVPSSDTILNLIANVKQQNKGYLTNLFLDLSKLKFWQSLNMLEYEVINDTVFIFRKNQNFTNLSYITTNISSLSNDLNLLKEKFSDKLFVD